MEPSCHTADSKCHFSVRPQHVTALYSLAYAIQFLVSLGSAFGISPSFTRTTKAPLGSIRTLSAPRYCILICEQSAPAWTTNSDLNRPLLAP